MSTISLLNSQGVYKLSLSLILKVPTKKKSSRGGVNLINYIKKLGGRGMIK